MGVTWGMLGGRVISNFQTLGAVTTHTFTVPAGRKWQLLFGRIERDVNTTLNQVINDPDGNEIFTLGTVGAGATDVIYPSSLAADIEDHWENKLFLLGGEWELVLTWGAAQNHPEVRLAVLEW